MFTNISFVAFAAVITSAPVLAAQNSGTDATVTPGHRCSGMVCGASAAHRFSMLQKLTVKLNAANAGAAADFGGGGGCFSAVETLEVVLSAKATDPSHVTRISTGTRSVADLSEKKFRAAALRERESAIASKRAARIARRFRPALPSRGNRRSVVSLEEAQRCAADAVYAPSP